MFAELGQVALLLGLLIAIVQGVLPLIGALATTAAVGNAADTAGSPPA